MQSFFQREANNNYNKISEESPEVKIKTPAKKNAIPNGVTMRQVNEKEGFSTCSNPSNYSKELLSDFLDLL